MHENDVKFYTRLLVFFGVVIFSVLAATTTYWTVDRVYQGHYVIVSPQTVVPTK